AGAGRGPAPRARSVYDPAGTEEREKRPAASESATRPAPAMPFPNSEITAPATGAPRVSSTTPVSPPSAALAAEAPRASRTSGRTMAARRHGASFKSSPPAHLHAGRFSR